MYGSALGFGRSYFGPSARLNHMTASVTDIVQLKQPQNNSMINVVRKSFNMNHRPVPLRKRLRKH